MSLLRSYQRLLKHHSLVVQATQTGLLMGAGDAIAQTLVERKTLKEYKPERTAKFVLLGTVFVGPTLFLWYRLLAKKFGTEMSLPTTLKKVACDQLLVAPIFLAIFVANVNLLNGHSLDRVKKELSTSYMDILVGNWTVWPAVQCFNFYFVPLNYQVLVVQSVAIGWNVYLSLKTHK